MPLIDSAGAITVVSNLQCTPLEDARLQDLLPKSQVILHFESYGEGRPFSWAGLLRSSGYTGQIIGLGAVGLDRLAYGFRVGFDLLELTEAEFEMLSDFHLNPFPLVYQTPRSSTDGNPIA